MRVLFRPEALEAAVAVASRGPNAFAAVSGEFRRVLLRRFPYSLVYELQGDTLVVLACFHHRRNPRTLSDRIKP
jgi:toxin ParE1/3/4